MPSNPSNTKPKYTKEELKQMNSFMTKAGILAAIGLAINAAVLYGLLNNKIDMSRYLKTKPTNLTDIGPRIQFVLQQSTPGIAWLVFCMFYVISRRAGSPAVDPTAGHEDRTASARNNFLNSLEQFVMSLASQLVLVTYLEPKMILNVIPVLNLLFISGRVLFWLGYPRYRSLGFMLSSLPIISTIGFISYKYYKIFV